MSNQTEENTDRGIRLMGWLRASQTIVLPLAAWIAVQIWGINTDLARLDERVRALRTEQDELQAEVSRLPQTIGDRMDKSTRELQVAAGESQDSRELIISEIRGLRRDVGRTSAEIASVETLMGETLRSVDSLRLQIHAITPDSLRDIPPGVPTIEVQNDRKG